MTLELEHFVNWITTFKPNAYQQSVSGRREGHLRKALFVSSYALKLKRAVRVSDGTTKCSIDTSLYAVYFSSVFDGSRTKGMGSLSGSAAQM